MLLTCQGIFCGHHKKNYSKEMYFQFKEFAFFFLYKKLIFLETVKDTENVMLIRVEIRRKDKNFI